MPQDKFFIGPYTKGLQTDLRAWLTPDNGFVTLENAYVFKDRVRKRFGSRSMAKDKSAGIAQLYTRVRISLGVTGASPSTINVTSTTAADPMVIGQLFSINDDIFTVYQVGAGVATLTTNPAVTAAIDTTVTPNTITFTGAAVGATVYFYPSFPIMGLPNYEQAAKNDEKLIAFDTRFSYEFSGNAWTRIGTVTWTGTDSDFFWAENYHGANSNDYYLFVTNYVTADQIKYLNGSTWTSFNPVFNAAGDTIESCLVIISFKNRLLFFNTKESVAGAPQIFRNRVRFSQDGSPIQAGAGVGAWLEDTPGKGGYNDAPTKESIVSAEFIKDRLIVYFERSTFELVFTGNDILPFRWQKINTELGAESTFSVVPFDKVVLGVGNVGIHACSGANVERIDEDIEAEVFAISNSDNGPQRVQGIRDYEVEQVYWSFPSITQAADTPASTFAFPDKVLVYNYLSNTWAINDDSITAFGYWQADYSLTWDSTDLTWQEFEDSWNEGSLQNRFRSIVAGNQQGYVNVLGVSVARNAPSLQVTNVNITTNAMTVVSHNLKVGDFIALENMNGLTITRPSDAASTDNVIFKVDSITSTTVIPTDITFAGTYTGGGTLARVSKMDIKTKQYNFYLKEGRNASVSKIDFQVDKTTNGSITVDYFASSSSESLLAAGTTTGAASGTGVLETSPYADSPLEQTQTRLWHSVYPQLEGEFVQIQLSPSYAEMINFNNATSDFELHSMLFHASQSGRLQ